MLKGLFSIEELFHRVFRCPAEGEEVVRKFGETCFNIGFEFGYNARKEEEVRGIRNK
jgi:hypothetical protein